MSEETKPINILDHYSLLIFFIILIFISLIFVANDMIYYKQTQINEKINKTKQLENIIQELNSTIQQQKHKIEFLEKERERLSSKQINNKLINWILSKNNNIDFNQAKLMVDTSKNLKHKYLVLAIAEVESTFNKDAKNKNNYGLMQINICNIKELKEIGLIESKHDLYKIKPAMKSADFLLSKHKTLKNKIIRYKGGYCQKYINKIMTNLNELKKLEA